MKIYKSGKLILVISLLLLFFPSKLISQQTDPYFRESGGFGYNLGGGPDYSLWWCEGAYKIMKDSPVPQAEGDTIKLQAAGNEYEPFQVVFNPEGYTDSMQIRITDLWDGQNSINSASIELRKAEYVYISKPTDSYGFTGWWPDPLPLTGDYFNAEPGKNLTFWITVYVAPGTYPGNYTGNLIISWPDETIELPVMVSVWNFSLPEVPTIRSGFGLSVDKIIAYHNLSDPKDIDSTFGLYMNEFRKYRISPYYFYALSPVTETISGIEWEGGIFDSDNQRSGKYSLRIVDDDPVAVISSSTKGLIPVVGGSEYLLKWEARTGEDKQQFCILVECYDKEGDNMIFENRMDAFTGTTRWKSYSMKLGITGENIAFVKILLFPAFRTVQGEFTGTTWFDNITLTSGSEGRNILSQGDFEVNADSISIALDFSLFDKAATKYLDGYGFNSFRLDLKGLGSGTYYSRKDGSFTGFRQGTDEYKKLMKSYLGQIENHLKLKGWLGKEYVYWFDEPGRQDYPFVREGMEVIKEGAPGINTFLTENDPGPEIMDVTDITCTIWHRINPSKARSVIENGNEYWSYLCTAPKYPWLSEFIDHDAINLRMWLWGTWSYGLNGILIWSSNYWTSRSASPAGYLQNPWEEPASFVQGYGWPLGKQTQWGNGDGRFFYPPNRNPGNDNNVYIEPPVPSIRLEFLRQGIEDYEYFTILKHLLESNPGIDSIIVTDARNLLDIPPSVFSDGETYTLNPADLFEYRSRLAEMIMLITELQ